VKEEVKVMPKRLLIDVGVAPLSRLSRLATVALLTGATVTLLGILGAELLLPPLASLGAFVFLPVLAGAWLLPARLEAPLITLAVAGRLVGMVSGSVHVVTAVAEILMVVTIGVTTLVAADRFRRWQEAQVRLREHARDLAAAAERERIAGRLTDDVTRSLFAITLDLQAAMGFVEQAVARQRIESAMGKLDDQIADLRHLAFERQPAEEAASEK
jgi:signal transduction histidine kinase